MTRRRGVMRCPLVTGVQTCALPSSSGVDYPGDRTAKVIASSVTPVAPEIAWNSPEPSPLSSLPDSAASVVPGASAASTSSSPELPHAARASAPTRNVPSTLDERERFLRDKVRSSWCGDAQLQAGRTVSEPDVSVEIGRAHV